MRELKGDWRDLFNGFMVALDLRKMFLALCGILFTVFGPLALTCLLANELDKDAVTAPQTFALDQIWRTVEQSWDTIYWGREGGYTPSLAVTIPYTIAFIVMVMAIWAYFGGAISRIASYEVARDGERMETSRALKFAGSKFWSFFMSPWICLMAFAFFAVCNLAGGFVGRLLDFAWIGAPLVAILMPLALLSGFVMTLVLIGSVAGCPLFKPAIAAEGTDAFDAVSRGFSYVYSRPWHYLLYQAVGAVYGAVCISFVILFAVTMCHLGLSAGAWGFDALWVKEPAKRLADPGPNATSEQVKAYRENLEVQRQDPQAFDDKHDRFSDINRSAWAMILSEPYTCHSYEWTPRAIVHRPAPYGRLMAASNSIVKPDFTLHASDLKTKWHRVAAYVVMAWLVIALGMALGYVPSYFFSQQSLIYYLMRKKVDGIEMNEVFEEPDEERFEAPPAAGPLDKPLVAPGQPPPPPAGEPPKA